MSKINVILLGPVGTGKTSALKTIPAAGHPLYVISTEPGIGNILTHDDALCHWCYIPPAAEPWDILEKNANYLNTLTNDQLQKMPGMNKSEYRQFLDLLGACREFQCDVCKQIFGPVDHLPEDAVFAIDGLSGLSKMSMDLVVGGKPIASQPDWGAAMNNLERFLTKCCADTRCSFALISHIDREQDEVTGGTKIMVSTLGRKLAPKIPRFFDEVVLCRKQGANFFWSTTESGVDLKARRLPFSDTIKPDFKPLLNGVVP